MSHSRCLTYSYKSNIYYISFFYCIDFLTSFSWLNSVQPPLYFFIPAYIPYIAEKSRFQALFLSNSFCGRRNGHGCTSSGALYGKSLFLSVRQPSIYSSSHRENKVLSYPFSDFLKPLCFVVEPFGILMRKHKSFCALF